MRSDFSDGNAVIKMIWIQVEGVIFLTRIQVEHLNRSLFSDDFAIEDFFGFLFKIRFKKKYETFLCNIYSFQV